eukprot:jgi/Tetstr1/442092/TSEL_030251.t1
MGTGVKNASVDGPCHTATSRGLESTLRAEDKAVLSVVFDECWPRDTQTGIPSPLKKTPRKHGKVGTSYFARHYFRDVGKDAEGRKKGRLPSEDRLAKARNFAEAWQQSELGRYYQAGKCPPYNVVFKGEEEVCEVTPHSEATVPTFGGKPIVSSVQLNKIVHAHGTRHAHVASAAFEGLSAPEAVHLLSEALIATLVHEVGSPEHSNALAGAAKASDLPEDWQH